MSINRIIADIDHINTLRDELKEHAVVYQGDHKRWLATFLGLPLDYFYSFSYQDWMKVSERYTAFTDEAKAAFNDCFESVPEFEGFTNKTEFKFVYTAYKQHVDSSGGNVKAEILNKEV